MILMHEFGWALGLGNSMIFDSVMYPYINSAVTGGTQPTFITDRFRKRELSFDDQITAGMAWGATFPATTGAISGQVLDGTQVAALMPSATAAAATPSRLAAPPRRRHEQSLHRPGSDLHRHQAGAAYPHPRFDRGSSGRRPDGGQRR